MFSYLVRTSTLRLPSVLVRIATTFCDSSRTEQNTVKGARRTTIGTPWDRRTSHGSARLRLWMAVAPQSISRELSRPWSRPLARAAGRRDQEGIWIRRRAPPRSGASSSKIYWGRHLMKNLRSSFVYLTKQIRRELTVENLVLIAEGHAPPNLWEVEFEVVHRIRA